MINLVASFELWIYSGKKESDYHYDQITKSLIRSEKKHFSLLLAFLKLFLFEKYKKRINDKFNSQ